jgi:PAS domain S-box-containing protein
MPKPLRVLLVEDSPDDADLVVRELERSGYAVTHQRVETADAMRAALARSSWDVVLSDYDLPGFSAAAALAVLQETGIDLPFVILSGTVGEEAAVVALKAGAHDFLSKNSLARLSPAIERELREVAQRRERHRAEEALRESEAQYRSLVEHAMFGIYRSSPEGRFLAVNPALVAMLGYDSAGELLAVPLVEVFADPSGRADLVRRIAEQGRVAGAEAIWKQKGGGQIRVRLSGRVTEGRDANRAGYEVIVEDITEQHRLQAQLDQAHKMEAIGRLAGGVAHDFNNMLTVILGYSELLTEQIGRDKPLGRDLMEIQAAAERAAALTRQLLAFSRKQVLAVTTVDLSDIARTIEPMLRRLLGAPITIETVLADDLHPVMGDVMQLEHLLVNLSVNARDAMPKGGVLTIATGNATLDEAFVSRNPGAKPGEYATLSVTDTGIGMHPEVQKSIFEPFFTTKEQGKGTGLGLAAVYGTVKQLGGYIRVESQLDHGSKFTIYLPKTEQPVPEPAARTSANPLPVGFETILLVEDESGVRAFARAVLQRFGYRVVEANSAEAALTLLKDFDGPIDLLLTDVVLPGLDGRELAVQVTRERPHLRVLFMSGYSSELRTADGFLIPGVPLIEKPFTAQALLMKTRQMLGADIESAGSGT